MLRDFDNGTVFSPPSQPPTPVQPPTPPPSSLPPPSLPLQSPSPKPPSSPAEASPAGSPLPNTGFDLRMAYRLIDVYKSELARMRRISLLAWIAVVAIAAVAAVGFWWGMTMSGQAGVERANVANLTGQQVAAGKALDKSAMELDALRADLRKAQADISGLREAIAGLRDDNIKATAQAVAAHDISIKSLSAVQAVAASLEAGISHLAAAASQPAMRQADTPAAAPQPDPQAQTAPSR
jgi:hypothetical protein